VDSELLMMVNQVRLIMVNEGWPTEPKLCFHKIADCVLRLNLWICKKFNFCKCTSE